jgi:hypothetical protein
MGKIYLDTILLSVQIKNIHFMLITLPFLNKLGDDYPFKKVHQKIKDYCNEKQIDCLDLYEEGFKGLNPTSLRVSRTDKHFNKSGTEIVAQILYKSLSPLKAYRNLSKIRGAFELKDILDENELPIKVDKEINNLIKDEDTLNFFKKDQTLTVRLEKENYRYQSLLKSKNNNISTTTLLTPRGEFFLGKKP